MNSGIGRGMVLAALLGPQVVGGNMAGAESVVASQGSGGVRYVCGGVGLSQSLALRSLRSSYPLSLLFANLNNEYLSDVHVQLTDSTGRTVVDTTAQGPICLIDVPQDTYVLEAKTAWSTKERTVVVGSRPMAVDLKF